MGGRNSSGSGDSSSSMARERVTYRTPLLSGFIATGHRPPAHHVSNRPFRPLDPSFDPKASVPKLVLAFASLVNFDSNVIGAGIVTERAIDASK